MKCVERLQDKYWIFSPHVKRYLVYWGDALTLTYWGEVLELEAFGSVDSGIPISGAKSRRNPGSVTFKDTGIMDWWKTGTNMSLLPFSRHGGISQDLYVIFIGISTEICQKRNQKVKLCLWRQMKIRWALPWCGGKRGKQVPFIGYFLLAPELMLFFLGFLVYSLIRSSNVYGESDISRTCFSDYRQK